MLERPARPHEYDDPDTPHPQLHALAEKTLTLEQTRQYARFEDPGFAEYDRLARRLDYELLSIVSAMAALQVYLGKLGERANRAPLAALERGAALLKTTPAIAARSSALLARPMTTCWPRRAAAETRPADSAR